MKPLAERFWAKVQKGEEGGCWEWKGHRNEKGYGKVYLTEFAKILGAHRVAYFLTHGVWPVDHCAHTCDNPPCCNPAHLVDMTPKKNVEDRVAKKRPGNRTSRKLTHEQVTWFLGEVTKNPPKQKGGLRPKGVLSINKMAEMLGVSPAVLNQIVKKGFYAEVPRPE